MTELNIREVTKISISDIESEDEELSLFKRYIVIAGMDTTTIRIKLTGGMDALKIAVRTSGEKVV